MLGDCLEVLRGLEAGSVDAVVTDPPSGIAFMSRNWDTFRCRSAFVDFLAPRLAECRRVARPGARMLCWALPRTSHWTATAIEDAGWLIESKVYHIFGQGFPKGKGQLKPAVEEWVLARKPGKGVPDLNVDACRISVGGEITDRPSLSTNKHDGYRRPWNEDPGARADCEARRELAHDARQSLGRWPASLCLSHHPACRQVGTKRVKGTSGVNHIGEGGQFGTKIYGDAGGRTAESPRGYGLETVAAWECHADCPVAGLDAMSGDRPTPATYQRNVIGHSSPQPMDRANGKVDNRDTVIGYGDSGGASRFFATFGYFPKASRRDRGEGNTHPTCKSQPLIRWLIRLICKPGDKLIDPFAGSGSTLLAALAEGVDSIGIEDDSEPGSFATAERRLAAVARRLT
jgi:DNA modification methylase